MKLTEAIDMSNLKKPIYAVGDAISTLEGVVGLGTKTDKKLIAMVKKMAKMDNDIHTYMNKNYKGWD
jgi:hypothetical protein